MVNLYKYSLCTFYGVLSLMTLSMMTGCDHSNSFEEIDQHAEAFHADQHNNINPEGINLNEVAGKATAPAHIENVTKTLKLSEAAQKLVGRYRVVISCEDKFVYCEQGSAEFILNLLPDGTAHRIFVHMGKVTFSSGQHYRKDAWVYDHHLNQVILIRGNGVQFYYDIDQQGNLVMNLNKIASFTPENRQYFIHGNPFPQFAYTLKKFE